MYDSPKSAYPGTNTAGYDEASKQMDDYSSELTAAKHAVEVVSSRLHALIDAIRGPRPEPTKEGGLISGKRSLKDALENTPGEIREICMHSEKQIAEIRAMLRL
jgi:hypothetical protein